MPDPAVSNDTKIITKVQKTAEISMIFKVHAYGEQTVVHHRTWQEGMCTEQYLPLLISQSTIDGQRFGSNACTLSLQCV